MEVELIYSAGFGESQSAHYLRWSAERRSAVEAPR